MARWVDVVVLRSHRTTMLALVAVNCTSILGSMNQPTASTHATPAATTTGSLVASAVRFLKASRIFGDIAAATTAEFAATRAVPFLVAEDCWAVMVAVVDQRFVVPRPVVTVAAVVVIRVAVPTWTLVSIAEKFSTAITTAK